MNEYMHIEHTSRTPWHPPAAASLLGARHLQRHCCCSLYTSSRMRLSTPTHHPASRQKLPQCRRSPLRRLRHLPHPRLRPLTTHSSSPPQFGLPRFQSHDERQPRAGQCPRHVMMIPRSFRFVTREQQASLDFCFSGANIQSSTFCCVRTRGPGRCSNLVEQVLKKNFSVPF